MQVDRCKMSPSVTKFQDCMAELLPLRKGNGFLPQKIVVCLFKIYTKSYSLSSRSRRHHSHCNLTTRSENSKLATATCPKLGCVRMLGLGQLMYSRPLFPGSNYLILKSSNWTTETWRSSSVTSPWSRSIPRNKTSVCIDLRTIGYSSNEYGATGLDTATLDSGQMGHENFFEIFSPHFFLESAWKRPRKFK